MDGDENALAFVEEEGGAEPGAAAAPRGPTLLAASLAPYFPLQATKVLKTLRFAYDDSVHVKGLPCMVGEWRAEEGRRGLFSTGAVFRVKEGQVCSCFACEVFDSLEEPGKNSVCARPRAAAKKGLVLTAVRLAARKQQPRAPPRTASALLR